MHGLFEPESVAIVGATPKEGKVGNTILKNIIAGFKGRIYPVNPSYTEILGIKSYSSVLDIPEADLVVISVPANSVIEVLKQCGEKGIKNAVVISAGFRETGRRGALLEVELSRICREYGINLVGPNCLGIINTHLSLNASFSKKSPPTGEIGFLSQSGALIVSVIDWAIAKNIGFSKIVSLGNKAVLDESDILNFLEKDEKTRVIMLYIEGIEDGTKFITTARRVSKKKPIVVMKSGKTEAGAKAASSHTGSLAGSYTAFQAAFQQSRVIQANSVEELFDYSLVLSSIQKLEGRVSIVTNSGGPGVIAADAIDSYGLEAANFGENTIRKLRELLPPEASFYNPVDVLGDSDADRFGKAVKIVAEDEDTGVIVAILTPTAQIDFDRAADCILETPGNMVTCFMGEESVSGAVEKLKEHGIVNFFDPVRAIRALSAVKSYEEAKRKRKIEPQTFMVNREEVRRIIDEVKRRRIKIVGVDALRILEAYGIRTAPYGLARTADEAVELAEKIGYPVAMKVVSPHIIHKSDVGCVKINVGGEDVRRAFFEILMRAEQIANARIDGVLIQKMVTDGKEVIVGMKRDPQFGPLLMFGLGGIYVEVFQDVSFRIAPISREDALEMVRSVKAYSILRGVRGEKSSDIESIIEILLRVSQMSIDFPEILEMDINPVKVFEKGYYAIDFRVITG
ncbi:MAG TPA: CoA-binding protein [Archaeoglobaceae archaeon]|nr:CoA-binding protein [Archaeoglobaceae archaeon]